MNKMVEKVTNRSDEGKRTRILPDIDKLWSIEAEAAVLGSILEEPKCIGLVLPLLDDKSFFRPENQVIYNSLVTLHVAGIPVDPISLRTDLKSTNQLDRVGGVDYIQQLRDSVCSAAHAVYYAGVVKDRQRYRGMVRAVNEITEVPAEPITVDEQIERIQSLALGLEQGKPAAEYVTFESCVEKIAAETQEEKTFIGTGLRNIDRIIDGVAGGEMIVLAGRPSMGKSALALQIAINMASSGLSILFFSLEMSFRALIERALKQKQVTSLKSLDVVLHKNGQTPEKQIAFIRTRKQTHKLDVVFIDYLQLMTTGSKSENRVQEISTISRKLKLAAVSEDVPIIALSQLNRAVENRDKHRPRLSDLRESGAIEQDADVVLLINREDYYRRNENPNAPIDGNTEVIIAKNRRGPTGIAELVFLDEKVTFGDKTNFKESLI